MLLGKSKVDPGFLESMARASGQKTLAHCYQCGKCTAGCPVAFAMDYKPNQIVRLLQLGYKDKVLGSRAIWVCSGCFTCTTRCPCNIDIAQVMDNLRIVARQEGKTEQSRRAVLFNELFLQSVRRNGRVFETGVAAAFNLSLRKPLYDAELGRFLLKRGKLRLMPVRIRKTQEIARLFAKR
ncbi:MAG: 4Fe-4S dicluster domain-containing protein [Bacillota bacterium]